MADPAKTKSVAGGEPAGGRSLPSSGDAWRDLVALMARLRTPGTGCPWDIEQTFETIAPYTIEEAYEVADAIQRKDMGELKGELGDLLFQSVFHKDEVFFGKSRHRLPARIVHANIHGNQRNIDAHLELRVLHCSESNPNAGNHRVKAGFVDSHG